MKPLLKKILAPATIAAIAALSGCAVGPDFVRPPAPQQTGYTALPVASTIMAGGAAQSFVAGQDIPAQWWSLFHSPALNGLIEQALEHNPTLQAAQAALRVAQETVYAQQGAYYPTVSASFMPSRQKTATGSVSPTSASGAPLFNLHTAQVNVSYQLDVFGSNLRQVESLQAQADAQRFELEAARLTLSSNVVAAAVQEASLRAQIAATVASIDLMAQQLQLLRQQLKAGVIAEAAVVAQEVILAQTRAVLPPLKKQLAQQRDLLAALAGRYPGDAMSETFELPMLDLPQLLPLTLPSKLVEQRPDVRAAEEQLHASSALIGVAKANMLPQLTLSASAGGMAGEIGQLFKSGNGFWNLASGLTQPLFEGGTLLHRKRAAEAAYEQSAAQYRSTVINAFQNVADTLQALQFDAEALLLAQAAERASASSVAITRRQVELGDTGVVSLLLAEQAYQQSGISLVQAQANRYADTAALFQALGGGWWNRSDEIAQPLH